MATDASRSRSHRCLLLWGRRQHSTRARPAPRIVSTAEPRPTTRLHRSSVLRHAPEASATFSRASAGRQSRRQNALSRTAADRRGAPDRQRRPPQVRARRAMAAESRHPRRPTLPAAGSPRARTSRSPRRALPHPRPCRRCHSRCRHRPPQAPVLADHAPPSR